MREKCAGGKDKRKVRSKGNAEENRESPSTQAGGTHIEHASKLYVLTMIMTLVWTGQERGGEIKVKSEMDAELICLRGKCIENAVHANAPLSGAAFRKSSLASAVLRALIDIYGGR